MIEVELKARCHNVNEVEKSLLESHFIFQKRVIEEDHFYTPPDRDFGETDEALRVRQSDGNVFITYKGPKMLAVGKTRREIELTVSDAKTAADLLVALRYTHSGTVKKRRSLFTYRDVTATIDLVEGLGTFVEVEKIVSEGQEREASDTLGKIAKKIGLKEFERRSYFELLAIDR